MGVDPKNIEFEVKFKEAVNESGKSKSALEVFFKANQYNFEKLNRSINGTKQVLDNHLDEHIIKDEKNAAIRGLILKGGAITAGAVGLILATLGVLR